MVSSPVFFWNRCLIINGLELAGLFQGRLM
jgi:hypothetical protein